MLRLADEDSSIRSSALEELALSKDERLKEFLESYQQGSLFLAEGKLVLCEKFRTDEQGNKIAVLSDPLTRQLLMENGKKVVVAQERLTEVSPSGRERRLVRDALFILDLWSEDPQTSLVAIQKCGDSRNPKFLKHLEELYAEEPAKNILYKARESINLILLAGDVPDQKAEDRFTAARVLSEMRSYRAVPVLQDLLKDLKEDSKEAEEYRKALGQIESYQRLVRGVKHVFNGISLGSVLILLALGLCIIFGLMGVINMAHGELAMLGAFTTYQMQLFFGHHPPDSMNNWYFLAALPASFLVAAFIGYLIEFLVVRHLYGRPLDSLLATWGVSLILIQAVRLCYGDNIGVNSPSWFIQKNFEVIQDLKLGYARCFIIGLSIFCVTLTYYLMYHTKRGLLVRATMQNREMADALGVNTRRIDAYTFALGAGFAGIAGCAWTLIRGTTPDMGQTNIIVDSFLVVVTGGVGSLAGVIFAGLGIGGMIKGLEPFFGAVYGKVLILLFVVLFIQWRPQGLFAPKGRLADD